MAGNGQAAAYTLSYINFQVGNAKYSGWLYSITKLGALIATKNAPRDIEGREIIIKVLNTKNEAIDQKARVEWAGKKIFGAEFI